MRTTTWADAPHCTDRTSTCPRAGWWSCRRHIRLVNPIASVCHARSHFVRRANAVRPITDLAALDSTLIMGSPRHYPIVITERASVCLTSPSASMISCFTMSRVCRGHSKERPNVPPSLVHLSQAPQGFCPSRGKAGFLGNTALLDEGRPDRSGECFKANAWAVGGIRFAKVFLPPGYLMYQNRDLRSGLSPITQENSHGRSQATIHRRRRFQRPPKSQSSRQRTSQGRVPSGPNRCCHATH